jgi:hypothetical protein
LRERANESFDTIGRAVVLSQVVKPETSPFDAAVDARARNGRNRHAETLHLASAVSSAVRHETRLESFLGGHFRRFDVGRREVDELFLAAVVKQLGPVQRERRNDARPVEGRRVEQFLRRDIDDVVTREPLGFELVEHHRNAKLGSAAALDADTAFVAENTGQRSGVVDDVLNRRLAIGDGNRQCLPRVETRIDGHGPDPLLCSALKTHGTLQLVAD